MTEESHITAEAVTTIHPAGELALNDNRPSAEVVSIRCTKPRPQSRIRLAQGGQPLPPSSAYGYTVSVRRVGKAWKKAGRRFNTASIALDTAAAVTVAENRPEPFLAALEDWRGAARVLLRAELKGSTRRRVALIHQKHRVGCFLLGIEAAPCGYPEDLGDLGLVLASVSGDLWEAEHPDDGQ